MENLPKWVAKVTSVWVAIGSFLVILGTQGVTLPEWAPELFSQFFVDSFLQVFGAVITFIQVLRGIFASQPSADVQILSAGQKRSFAINPFKLKVA